MTEDRASATARLVAAAMVLLEREGRGALIPPGAAEWSERLLWSVPADRWLVRSVRSSPGRRFWRFVEAATLPGIIDHFAWRKVWIESRCRAALAEGFGQVVVIGAGLDTLTLRLAAEGAAVNLIETDHPATQRSKRAALGQDGGHVRFVPCDLSREDLRTALTREGVLQRDRAAFVVVEGLLMYLDEARVRSLLRDIAELPCPAVRLAFTYMERPEKGPAGFRPRSRMVDWWLRRRDEPFLWSIAPEDIDAFIEALGFDIGVHQLPTYAAGNSARAPLTGENFVLAERASRPG